MLAQEVARAAKKLFMSCGLRASAQVGTDGVPARSRIAQTSPIGYPICVTIAPRGSIENLRFPVTHLDEQTHPAVITTDRHQQQDSFIRPDYRETLWQQVVSSNNSATPTDTVLASRCALAISWVRRDYEKAH
jgi:hypothetical protein